MSSPYMLMQLKEWRSAQAECVLQGFAAHLLEDDRGQPMLVVSRWHLCRSFKTPEEVRAWLTTLKAELA